MGRYGGTYLPIIMGRDGGPYIAIIVGRQGSLFQPFQWALMEALN
jgi:hypothetical protein